MKTRKRRSHAPASRPTKLTPAEISEKPALESGLPLLVLSSDEGFGSKIRDLASSFDSEIRLVPLAGFGPAEVERKNAAAIVDCRSYFGVAQQVVKNLHETHRELPILVIIADKEQKEKQKDLLYGAGASICLYEETGMEILQEGIHFLLRIVEMSRRAALLDETLQTRNEEIANLRREMEASKLQLVKRVQEQITVYRASRAMLSVFDFDDLANDIVRLATIELDAEVGSLMLIEGEDLVVRALHGQVPGEAPIMGRRQKVGEGISGWVAREGRPLLITDFEQHEQFRERGGVRYKTKSCISCPLITRGRIRGVINITNKKGGGHFTDDDLRLLRTLAMTAAVALDNFELVEQIKRSETMSSIGELAARMAHEIRNPLHAIKMTIQILGKKFTLDEEYYGIILGEIERLENLVREVLSFVRKDTLKLTGCDLSEVVDHTLAVLKSLLDQKGVKVMFDRMPEMTMTKVDEAKIEQAVMNIIVNAAEAMPKGGELQISTGIVTPFIYPRSQYGEKIANVPRDQRRHAVIVIRDNGIGIDRKYYDKVFQPFFTTKIDGTGLGLSTTRKIIEAHGGKIIFESEVNVGTSFKIELPIIEETSNTEGAEFNRIEEDGRE